jgi:hypothetical protein
MSDESKLPFEQDCEIETPRVIATFGVSNSPNAVQVSALCSDCLREGLKKSTAIHKNEMVLGQVIEETWGQNFAVTIVNGNSVCLRHATQRLAFEGILTGKPGILS